MNQLLNFSKECNDILFNNWKAKKAYEYTLDNRGLSPETMEEHLIGFCPWDHELDPNIRYYGEDLDNEDKRDWRYNLWGKLIVPIYDEFGEVVSLTTKKPEVGKNPWWNLPFVKGNVLFLLDKAKETVIKENKIYIVEGYADALTMYQHGIKNVAALMGTALTLRKISLIARYCNNVCFCFDVDENMSGQRACDASVVMLNKYCFCDEISVINGIPIGEDPASYVTQYGAKEYLGFEKYLSKEDIQEVVRRVDQKQREETYVK